jgi:Ca2+-binding EF-hand superfamily protein
MITVEELKEVFEGQGKDEQTWDEIMEEVDKNNDNMISLKEFLDVTMILAAKNSKSSDNR